MMISLFRANCISLKSGEEYASLAVIGLKQLAQGVLEHVNTAKVCNVHLAFT
jgi:hypothetical protein